LTFCTCACRPPHASCHPAQRGASARARARQLGARGDLVMASHTKLLENCFLHFSYWQQFELAGSRDMPGTPGTTSRGCCVRGGAQPAPRLPARRGSEWRILGGAGGRRAGTHWCSVRRFSGPACARWSPRRRPSTRRLRRRRLAPGGARADQRGARARAREAAGGTTLVNGIARRPRVEPVLQLLPRLHRSLRAALHQRAPPPSRAHGACQAAHPLRRLIAVVPPLAPRAPRLANASASASARARLGVHVQPRVRN